MHGLINRSIQSFLRETYGTALWAEVAGAVGLAGAGFEAMLHYDDALTDRVLDVAAQRLGKPRLALMEDLGAFLVTLEPLRRLLRFGGVDYTDFLMSLDELQGRGLMALPDLDLPELMFEMQSNGHFMLLLGPAKPGWGAVFAGVLRAMADDYGALATIETGPATDGRERLLVELHDARFAVGRRFDLAQSSGGA